jgi:hypothetical protein
LIASTCPNMATIHYSRLCFVILEILFPSSLTISS